MITKLATPFRIYTTYNPAIPIVSDYRVTKLPQVPEDHTYGGYAIIRIAASCNGQKTFSILPTTVDIDDDEYIKTLEHEINNVQPVEIDSDSTHILVKVSVEGDIYTKLDQSGAVVVLEGYISGKYAKYIYSDANPERAYPAWAGLEEIVSEEVKEVPDYGEVGFYITVEGKYTQFHNGGNYNRTGEVWMAAIDTKLMNENVTNRIYTGTRKYPQTIPVEGVQLAWTRGSEYRFNINWATSMIKTHGMPYFPQFDDDYGSYTSVFLAGGELSWHSDPDDAFILQTQNGNAIFPYAIVSTIFFDEVETTHVESQAGSYSGVRAPKGSHDVGFFFNVEQQDYTTLNLSSMIFRMSGGTDNQDLLASLGGSISDHSIAVSEGLLISEITREQQQAGAKLPTCLYLHNGTGVEARGLRVHVELDNVYNADISLTIGYSEVNGEEEVLENREDRLEGLSLSNAYTEASGLILPPIPSGQHVAIWVMVGLINGSIANNESFRLVLTQRV